MKAEIITIGDEILLGQTINTNAAYISKKLTEIGIEVIWVTTIGDNAQELISAIATAEKRANVVISTGGLGPTHDDMTKKIYTTYFKTRLVLHEPTLLKIKRFFNALGLEMPQINEEQALVPENADIIDNNIGTAPGLIFRETDTYFFVLPGVPGEMKNMMDTYIIPFLKNRSGKFIKYRIIKTTGIGESALFEKIGDIEELEKKVKIAFLPKSSGVEIRLTAVSDHETQCVQNIELINKEISSKIKEYIWGYDNQDIENIIGQLLLDQKKSIAIAETYTGGLISHKLSNISQGLDYLRQSVVVFQNEGLTTRLGIPRELIDEKGVVSENVAVLMAKNIRTDSNTDYGLAATFISVADQEKNAIPVGMFYAAVADRENVVSKKFTLKMDSRTKKGRVTQLVLDLLRRQLLKI